MEGVSELKDVTLVYGGAGTLQVYTDMPGSSIALRRTISLVATIAPREQRTFPLDMGGDLFGRLVKWRAVPTPGQTLLLFAGSYRFRRIGVYLDGAAGDVWETQELSLGV